MTHFRVKFGPKRELGESVLTKFASLLPSAPNIGKTRIEHPRICYFRRAFGVIDAWTFFFPPLPLPLPPGSAKRSGERGKRSRSHTTTTPKAAPSPQMRASLSLFLKGIAHSAQAFQISTAPSRTTPVLLFWTAQRPVFSSSQEEKMGGWPRSGAARPRAVRRRRNPPSRPRGAAIPRPRPVGGPPSPSPKEKKGPRPRAAQRPIVPRLTACRSLVLAEKRGSSPLGVTPHCAPTATAGRNTASAACRLPPWPGWPRRRPP